MIIPDKARAAYIAARDAILALNPDGQEQAIALSMLLGNMLSAYPVTVRAQLSEGIVALAEHIAKSNDAQKGVEKVEA